jgi:hypothetical protein
LKKLARATAFRLGKEYLEKQQLNAQRTFKKGENKFNIKPAVKVISKAHIGTPYSN